LFLFALTNNSNRKFFVTMLSSFPVRQQQITSKI